jgi:hypothetical protein
MVTFGGLDPDHVVEQQLVAIGRGQTLMGAPWRADHHFTQLSYFGMNAEGCALGIRHDDLPRLKS